MKWISYSLMVVGIIFLTVFSYSLYENHQNQTATMKEAEHILGIARDERKTTEEKLRQGKKFKTESGGVYGILTIPKLNRSVAIVEGTDPDSLKNGVGHLKSTVHPSQQEQIVLSGHRDTVFRDFGKLEIGDSFIIEMPYGDFEYEIKNHKIVDWDDESIIGKMGEEVLVVSTCYPFSFVGPAPERFVLYAYPK